MNVTTGAECSGMSSTVRPFDSSVYSEIAPTVRTYLKPGTLAWRVGSTCASAAADGQGNDRNAARNCFMG